MQARLTQFVEQESDCFKRQLLKGHITGSAWIVDQHYRQALLLHHAKLNRWLQPGGHSDGHWNTYEVALREAQEETGLTHLICAPEKIFDIDIHVIPANSKEPQHFHYDVRFLFQVDASNDLQANEESHDLKWFPLEKIQIEEQSIQRMIRKTYELQR
ncbi:MAG: NUDIX hydrolase [Gammaproteobacteria bacterium]|nr:NUDIX hydrolase [Gammaproteobacteria bacterium]MDH5727450.1 NUDIX hydrolase [Gammaproteobacteria bacterium]